MSDNLKSRAASGVIWSGIHKLASAMLGLVSSIVLARLLTPYDYGIIGMLAIFMAISNTFIDGGFGAALIQKKNPTDADYSTILYWNVGLSIVLYVLLFACAPLIAAFYNLPLLSEVLRIQGVVLIINAARIVQHNQLRKHLEFKKVAIINLSSSIVSLIFTIYRAWRGWGVWALVAQQIMVGTLCTIQYWILAKWHPIKVFSLASFKELFNFGGFILLSNLINTFFNNIQGLLIGKFYSSTTLGYYSKARDTEAYASTFISSVLDQVSFPVLAEAKDDRNRMISILKAFVKTSAFVTFPIMFLLILLAKPLFLLLYSDRWLASVSYFQLLCIAGIAVCLQSINYYAIASIGKSKLLFKWTIIKRIIGLVLVIGGLLLGGIYGLLIGSVVTSWTIYVINAYLVSKYLGYSGRQQFLDLLPIIIVSGVSFVIPLLISKMTSFDGYIEGLMCFSVYVILYLSLSLMLKMDALILTQEMFCKIINRFTKKCV